VTILPIKHKSISTDTEIQLLKKENRTQKKTKISSAVQVYNENIISEVSTGIEFVYIILRRLVSFLVELQYFK